MPIPMRTYACACRECIGIVGTNFYIPMRIPMRMPIPMRSYAYACVWVSWVYGCRGCTYVCVCVGVKKKTHTHLP